MAGRDLSEELYGAPGSAGGRDLSEELFGKKKPGIRGDGYDAAMNYSGRDAVGGAIRGVGSIGATIIRPFESSADNQKRRTAMDDSLASLVGSDPNSTAYQTSKLGTEVLATAPFGGFVAKGVSMIPGAARALPTLLPAIQSGGMSANGATGVYGMANRVAGGAVNGAVTAGAVDPQHSGTGMMIGGFLPPAVKLAGETGRLVGNAVSGLAKNTLGMTTGAGAETFSTAFQAGRAGGTSFLDNMRGNVPLTDVLDSAKDALSKMRIERGNQYRSGMVDIANDRSVINFAPIDGAVNSLKTMGSFKGQVINKNAAGTVEEITGLVNQWKNLNPAEYHTPEGLDALKKAIGDIRDATQFGTPGRKAADTAYNVVKGQIEMQAPTYSRVMKDYSKASETLTEIEKALSLGNKAAADTSMRKLQSLMRNNVNTNYGNRLGLANTLEGQGADILPAVAGQAASSMTPRGLQGLAATGAGLASFANPATLAALPFTSPRLMGELSYGLGAMTRGIGGAGNAALPNVQQGLLAGQQAANNSQGTLTQGAYRMAPLLGAEYLFSQ